MYLNTTVKIPVVKGKIITKKKGGATYILQLETLSGLSKSMQTR